MITFKSALTIAGTDPSGGAGIQADLKTFQEFKTYGMSVITSVVAQNTTGVQAIHHIPIQMINQQLDAVFSDIRVNAVKTGMIANIDMMQIIVQQLKRHHLPLVIDPVMVATSGDALINEAARQYLQQSLLPLCTVVTPNIPEAEFFIERSIETTDDMIAAAKEIVHSYKAGAALITGGHLEGDAVDILYDGNDIYTFREKRIHTINTHGTGCTYSAAITANLAKGLSLIDAVNKGKQYITEAIRHSFDIGAGNGPTNHWAIREKQHADY